MTEKESVPFGPLRINSLFSKCWTINKRERGRERQHRHLYSKTHKHTHASPAALCMHIHSFILHLYIYTRTNRTHFVLHKHLLKCVYYCIRIALAESRKSQIRFFSHLFSIYLFSFSMKFYLYRFLFIYIECLQCCIVAICYVFLIFVNLLFAFIFQTF